MKKQMIKKELNTKTLNPPCDTISQSDLRGNIENFIGWTAVPTGLTTPLLINGDFANGLYRVPLATSEGALVASYSRGATAITKSGGANTLIVKEAIQRCPLFQFRNAKEALVFTQWCEDRFSLFRYTTTLHSRFAALQKVSPVQEGNNVSMVFEFTTAEAAGQNMITICTQAICDVIVSDCPIKALAYYVEGNFSGDKKATSSALHHVRGKRVVAEVTIPSKVIRAVLKSTASNIHEYWLASTMANIQSGTIGVQGHFANGLTALYMATGQDVACVAESAIGITRMQCINNDLYTSVTLPSLIIGTVGGGTGLPTQQQCLNLLECKGPNSSKKLAEITAGLVLGGELSIAAALAEGHFTQAHISLGRKK